MFLKASHARHEKKVGVGGRVDPPPHLQTQPMSVSRLLIGSIWALLLLADDVADRMQV